MTARYQAHRAGDRRPNVSDALTVASEFAVLLLMFLVVLYGLPVLAALAW